MRLASHKLPKGVNKQVRTAKHKDSAKHQTRKEKKAAKANEMQEDAEEPVLLSPEEKEAAKLLRKKANAHKVAYKKNNIAMTGRNGPRACNTHSIYPTDF